MTSSQQIDGKTMEILIDFIFLGFKITADGDCNHEIKDAPWKKSYKKPRQHIKKQRHYFANKGPFSQSYFFFPVVTCGCENWAIKKAEHQRFDSVELWCWIRFLRVPWTARGSNQSILKEISSEYSLEGLMLRLKFQYIGPPHEKS